MDLAGAKVLAKQAENCAMQTAGASRLLQAAQAYRSQCVDASQRPRDEGPSDKGAASRPSHADGPAKQGGKGTYIDIRV